MTEHYPFSLPPLTYPYDALEPYINQKTVVYHHDLIFKSYVEKLNNLLSNYPQYQDWSLKALVVYGNSFPTLIKDRIKLFSSGIYNHTLYFDRIGEQHNTKPSGKLLAAIVSKYGSFEKFEENVVSIVINHYGSGYVWFAFNAKMDLILLTTKVQDTPPLAILTPLFTIDYWEHAFMIQYDIKKEDYIRAVLSVLDWDKICSNYKCPQPCLSN